MGSAMTQPTHRPQLHSETKAAATFDFADPSDICDFGYVLAVRFELEEETLRVPPPSSE
jgi:hypothetical protein